MIKLRNMSLKLTSMLGCLMLLSCANNSSLVSSSYSTFFSLVTSQFFQENDLISAEVIENIPYASSLINFERNPKSLMILESKQGDIYRWVSSDSKVFLFEDGRIIGTRGLINDLYKIERPDVSFQAILNENDTLNHIAYYSFRKPSLNNLKVEIAIDVIGKEKIDILNRELELVLIEERLISKKINWKATNRYWIDPKNFYVWKSTQNISPRLPLIYIETTKKPAQ